MVASIKWSFLWVFSESEPYSVGPEALIWTMLKTPFREFYRKYRGSLLTRS